MPRYSNPSSPHPGPAPRQIDRGLLRFASGRTQVIGIVGAVFAFCAVFPVVVSVIMFALGNVEAGLLLSWPLLLLVGGGYAMKWSLAQLRQRKDVAINGTPVVAEVMELGWDRSVSQNGRNPYVMEWRFAVDGRSYFGRATTLGEEITAFDIGDRIWVLYDEGDPSISIEWPVL